MDSLRPLRDIIVVRSQKIDAWMRESRIADGRKTNCTALKGVARFGIS